MSLFDQLKRVLGAVQSGDTLRARVFRGGAWLGAGSFAEQAVRFARNIVLARLLAAEAFGTMAIVLSATTLVHTITDIGVKDAIIQNPKGTEDRYVDTAFWLTVGRSLFLFSLIFISAPWLAHFYGNVGLTSLLQAASLTVVIDGAVSPRIYVAMKQLKFSKWAAITHGGGICGVVVTIILSYFLRNVWALVIGVAAESLSRTILSYVFFPYLPSFTIDREALRELLRFSRGLFGLSLLNLVFARTDIFVLAKILPAAELGLYALAINLVQTPTSFLMNLLGQTLMPTLSHVQESNQRMNRILVQVSSLLVYAGIPALVFVYFCGHSLLALAYGDRYAAASGALVVASAVALLNLLNGQITTIFYAKGLPQLHRRSVALMAIVMIALIYPFSKLFGMVGAQIACLLSVVVGYGFQVLRIRHLTGIRLMEYGSTFLTSAVISCTVAAVCLAARFFSLSTRPLTNIATGLLGCIIAYICVGFIFLRNARETV